MPSESEIIKRLRQRAGVNDEVRLGIGDDAAVIKTTAGKDLIACCDLMVEGVHFRTEWTPPRLLGRKALAVNLSDVAAMGAVPKFAMMSIALPHKCSSAFIDELFLGVFELAEASGVSIIGGDTSISGDSLFIDISVIGDCQSGNAVTRRGAKIGDRIYVSGSLGASALGLSLLEDGYRLSDLKDPTDAMRQQAILKHLAPEPQLRLGRAIGEAELATAMIDISDGLSTDLSHILDESGCGAIIHSGNIPIAACLLTLASETDRLRLALHGGEEYELLFTARPESQRQVSELSDTLGTTLTTVGEITEEKGLRLERGAQLEPILPSGFEHII